MYVVEFQILIFVAGTYKQVNLLLKISKRKNKKITERNKGVATIREFCLSGKLKLDTLEVKIN